MGFNSAFKGLKPMLTLLVYFSGNQSHHPSYRVYFFSIFIPTECIFVFRMFFFVPVVFFCFISFLSELTAIICLHCIN